jgi:hypothetical protein
MKRFSFPLKTSLTVCLVLAFTSFSGGVPAQWIVQDPTAISKMVKEYVETAKRWKAEYEHYQQQLIKLKQLGFVASEFVDNFPERDGDYGMKMACPGSTGGPPTNISDAFRQLAPDMKGNVVEEQRKLCQRIVLAENAKYNETVRMLKTLILRQRELQSVEQQRASVGTSQGALAANDNEIQRLLARTTMDMEFWQTRITAYDKYIESLKWDSDQLAKCAMRGCENGLKKLFGNVVQAAALKAALSGD